jgi:hypothetical protein
MFKFLLIALLPLLFPFSNGVDNSANNSQLVEDNTNVLEKMVVVSGNITIKLDSNRLNGIKGGKAGLSDLRFTAGADSFFTALVFSNEFRSPMPSAMKITPQDSGNLPNSLKDSAENLVIESLPWGNSHDLVIRDSKTGFTFFNLDGYVFDYNATEHLLSINDARILISKEFAKKLGRSADENVAVGTVSIAANMKTIEASKVDDGEESSGVLPAGAGISPNAGTAAGPDVIVGDLSGLAQFGTSGTQVGLAVGTDSCNNGQVDLNWVALPSNNHPVIPQNLYRMSGGTTNDRTFEQIGESSVKHAFTALTNNICGFGCNGVGGSNLGSGCSDPYSASLNAGSGNALGSRAWINPFTGVYPRGDSTTPPNTHTGHTHTGVSHRILVEASDLNTTLNPGATYYTEGQYVTPHEFTWCAANPGQCAACPANAPLPSIQAPCNPNNNVSYRRYTVTGTTSFTFTTAATTVRKLPAIAAWTGASFTVVQPDPANDGIAIIAYKVTNPSAGVWHYEYAVYNQNLDRGIQSFSIPLGNGATLSNTGFHAPPQHQAWDQNGPQSTSAFAFSSTPWTPTQTSNSISWASETLAQNQMANAIRWGTLYNFRFDSNAPPQNVNATVGFFKTGSPVTAAIQAPSAVAVPKSRADFDGDGKSDLSVFRGSEGNWYVNRSTSGFWAMNWGLSGDVLVPGDYDGDGKADTAIFRASANAGDPDFYVLNSNGFTVSGVAWGTTGDIPFVADYDGDGKTDFCIRRSSNNTFYVLHANGTSRDYTFGLAGDKPVTGDYDGDGKADFGVFRPSTSTWYIAKSTDNSVITSQWGLSTDIPVFADYDGDNKDDIAVFRPSDGTWYIQKSSGGTSFIPFGANGDIPVPGDYDGDGKDDPAVYRGGNWYELNSTSGFAAIPFGIATDRPIPREYLPQ